MNEFELKRLRYFLKEAVKNGWIQVAPTDADWINWCIKEAEKDIALTNIVKEHANHLDKKE